MRGIRAVVSTTAAMREYAFGHKKNDLSCDKSFYYGAEGETRTRTRGEPRWILSPLRLPFRHFGMLLYSFVSRIIIPKTIQITNTIFTFF